MDASSSTTGGLAGKVALVTGASRGIGKAIAQAFALSGANVAVTGRTSVALESLVADLETTGVSALAVPADLEDEEAPGLIVETVESQLGRIDILVNNAGIIHPPIDLVDFDPDEWRRVIEVNLVAPALLIRATLPIMIRQGSGKILNISSIGGRRGGKGRSAYRATKAALISLTESAAAEAKPHGVDVLCICPGPVDTEGYREAFTSEARAKLPAILAAEEIANLAVFLCTESSSAITGTAIDAFGNANPLFA